MNDDKVDFVLVVFWLSFYTTTLPLYTTIQIPSIVAQCARHTTETQLRLVVATIPMYYKTPS